jgi:hypothetical protein
MVLELPDSTDRHGKISDRSGEIISLDDAMLRAASCVS